MRYAYLFRGPKFLTNLIFSDARKTQQNKDAQSQRTVFPQPRVSDEGAAEVGNRFVYFRSRSLQRAVAAVRDCPDRRPGHVMSISRIHSRRYNNHYYLYFNNLYQKTQLKIQFNTKTAEHKYF